MKVQYVQNLLALEKVDGLNDLSSFSSCSFLATNSVSASSDTRDNSGNFLQYLP